MSRGLRMLTGMARHLVKLSVVTVSNAIKDGVAMVQTAGIDEGDVDDVEAYMPPGFLIRPPKDAEAIQVMPMAEGPAVVVGFSGRGFAPTKLSDNSEIPEQCGGLYRAGSFVVYVDDAGKLYLGGDKGNVTEAALLGDTAVTLYDAHVHPSPFGPTGAPTVSLSTAKSATVLVKA